MAKETTAVEGKETDAEVVEGTDPVAKEVTMVRKRCRSDDHCLVCMSCSLYTEATFWILLPPNVKLHLTATLPDGPCKLHR